MYHTHTLIKASMITGPPQPLGYWVFYTCYPSVHMCSNIS